MSYEDERFLLTKEKFLGFWSPRVGSHAAILKFRVMQLHWIGVFSLWSYMLSEGIGVGERVSVLATTANIFLASGVGTIVSAGCLERKINRIVSDLLGIKVATRAVRFPPRINRKYEEWCRQNDIKPYAAVTYYEKLQVEQKYGKWSSSGLQPTESTLESRYAAQSSGPKTTTSTTVKKSALNVSSTGWHPDPTGRFPQRYFNGTSWSAWVIDQSGAEIQDPQGAPTPSPP